MAPDLVRRLSPATVARPKSRSFTWPWVLSMMLEGLMSRWVTPWEWA